VTEQVAELDGQIELRLAILEVVSGPRIDRDLEGRGVDLIAPGQLYGVGAGKNARAGGGLKERLCRGRNDRGFELHGPGGAVQSAVLAAGDGIEQLAILIKDFDLKIAEDVAALLVVGDEGVDGTAGTGEGFVALGPAAVGVHVLDRGLAGEQDRVFLHEFWREGTERRDVIDNPDTAAVRGKNEVVFARVNHDIAHRDRGKIASLVFSPPLTAIDGDPEAELRAQQQQRGAHRVLFDDMSIAAHAARSEVEHGPAFAIVGGLGSVGLDVAEGVSVEGGVGRAFIKVAGVN